MKKVEVKIYYEQEKLDALKMYLDKKGMKLEGELETQIEKLYEKLVPQSVKEYISLKDGKKTDTQKKKYENISKTINKN